MDAIDERRIWKWLALLLVVLVATAGFAAQVSAGQEAIHDFYFMHPINGQTVEGDVEVKVFVPLGPGQRPYKNVELSIGGGPWQPMTYFNRNAEYTLKWDTAYYQNGPYTLTARYMDWSDTPVIYITSIDVFVCQSLQPCINP